MFLLRNIKLIKELTFQNLRVCLYKSAAEEWSIHSEDFDSLTLSNFLLERNINTNYQVSYDPSARHN